MKNLLIIAYYFPPAGGSAVQRTLKFVKYLPSHGWQPIVLTAREDDHVLRDDSLSAEVPENIEVIRAAAPDPYRWYGRLTGKGGSGSVDLSAMAVSEDKTRGLMQKIGLKLRASVFIPDARIGWLPFALGRARRIFRQHKVDAIFTTSPPFTTALLGGILNQLTGLPWISDYRDPWTQAYFYFKRPVLSRSVEDRLERWLISRANRIVSVNDGIIDGLRDKYGLPSKDRQAVIPNGYDPDDFIDLVPRREKTFTVTYTGTLNALMGPEPLIQALENLIRMHPEMSEQLRLSFIGRIGPDVMPVLQNTAIRSCIQILPHTDHRTCLGYTVGSDALLLLIPFSDHRGVIVTGKIFEYLRAGVPILNISGGGEASRIIKEAKAGLTVAPDDLERMQGVLWEWYRRWKRGRPLLDHSVRGDVIQRYDRKNHAAQLAGVLDGVIKPDLPGSHSGYTMDI